MTKELTIQQRASAALSIHHTELQLMEMAEKTSDIIEIKDKADYQLVKSSAIALRDVRISIEKAGKVARDDANNFSKAVLEEQRRLVGIIGDEETRLKELRQEVDGAAAKVKAEAARKEEARIEDIQENIATIHRLTDGLINATADEINSRIISARSVDIAAYDEFDVAARYAKDFVVKALEEAMQARLELESQKAEQARVAEQQAEEQARLDAQREKLEEEQERIDSEERERVEKLKEEERKESIAKQKAEQEKLAKERIEREKAQAVEDEKKRVAAAKAEEERQISLMPAKEKLASWAESLKNANGPAGIKGKNQQAIVNKALAALGEVGNDIHAGIKAL